MNDVSRRCKQLTPVRVTRGGEVRQGRASRAAGAGASPTTPGAALELLEGRQLLTAVTGFTLVDSATGADVTVLTDGTTLDLGMLPTRHLNIRANVDGEVESVLFSLDGVDNVAADDDAPYALAGDDAGVYRPWTPSPGSHTLAATPYSEDGAAGAAGAPHEIHFTVIDDAPSAPGGVRVTAVAPDAIELTWQDNSDNELGFVIERTQDYGRRYATVAVLAADATSYTDSKVLPGRAYRYRIQAFNPAGRSGRAYSRFLRLIPPLTPHDLAAAGVSPSEIRLTWGDVAGGPTGFRLERSLDGVMFETVADLGATERGYTDAGLAASTSYHYRVIAYNVVGASDPSPVASATTAPAEVTYSGPVVITSGGTYSGNWESLDPDVPAVTIRTTDPVVIENSNVRGRGDLIKTGVDHGDVTVRNTRGYGMNPDVYGEVPGRFFEGLRFDSVTLENNYLEGTSGINLFDYRGDYTADDTVRVIANRALNIDGRKSDGQGGFLDFDERTRLIDGETEKGYRTRQFVQLNRVMDVPGVEIAWNEIVNEPGKSRVEDNISIYFSGGTADSPLRIHDNYVQGAYNVKPWQASYEDDEWKYDWGYSGGGIMLGDGSGAYVEAYDNQVVSTSNYGIAISAGHDMRFYNNRVVSSGLLADGRPVVAQNVGVYIWDLHDSGSDDFYNNSAHDNLVGWVKGTRRNDWWVPDATSFENNTSWPGEVTLATEAAEFKYWLDKVAAADMTVGPTA